MQGVHLSPERFISCFHGARKEVYSIPLALAIFKVTLIPSNQYAIVLYLWAVLPEPQHCISDKGLLLEIHGELLQVNIEPPNYLIFKKMGKRPE